MLFWIKLYLAKNWKSHFVTLLFLSLLLQSLDYSAFLFSSSSLFFSASYQSCLALAKSLSYLTSSKRFTPFHKLKNTIEVALPSGPSQSFLLIWGPFLSAPFSSLTTTLLYFHELSLRKPILHWPAPFGNSQRLQDIRHLESYPCNQMLFDRSWYWGVFSRLR